MVSVSVKSDAAGVVVFDLALMKNELLPPTIEPPDDEYSSRTVVSTNPTLSDVPLYGATAVIGPPVD